MRYVHNTPDPWRMESPGVLLPSCCCCELIVVPFFFFVVTVCISQKGKLNTGFVVRLLSCCERLPPCLMMEMLNGCVEWARSHPYLAFGVAVPTVLYLFDDIYVHRRRVAATNIPKLPDRFANLMTQADFEKARSYRLDKLSFSFWLVGWCAYVCVCVCVCLCLCV